MELTLKEGRSGSPASWAGFARSERKRYLARFWAPWTIVLLGAAMGGCGEPSPGAAVSAPATAANDTVSPENTDELLSNAIRLLTSGHSGNATAFDQVRKMLNNWLHATGAGDDLTMKPELERLLEPMIESERLAEVASKRFAVRDAEHVRDAFLFRDVAQRAQGDALTELDRARAVLEWVGTYIHSVPPDEVEHLVLGPLYTLMMGRGTDVERAWLYMMLLRQLKIETVLVGYPSAEEPEQIVPWTPGVVSQGEVYLFDVNAGRPIAGAGEEEIATLRACAADPTILQGHHMGAEARPQASDLREATLLVEATPMYWSPRMALLESKLSGERGVVLYHDYGSQEGESFLERLARAAGDAIDTQRVVLWQYPFEVERFRLDTDRRVEQERLRFLAPLTQVPAVEQARVAQLRGEWEQAIPRLQSVRAMEGTTKLQRRFIPQAQESSTYWLGLATLEKGDYTTAANWFRLYLNKYPDGRWAAGAQTNLTEAEQQAAAS